MDNITCQRCNSNKVVKIEFETKGEETINFSCGDNQYHDEYIPKTLKDFGEYVFPKFCVCFDCGQHFGTFPKSIDFLNDKHTGYSDEEEIWNTCKCGSQNINSKTNICSDCGELFMEKCRECQTYNISADRCRFCDRVL